MFADDSLLFCKATNSACNTLKQIINNFCSLSGQLVNFHKSIIVFSKLITDSRRDTLAGLFNMTKSTSLTRYVGAHFSGFSPNKQDYARIMQKNESRIFLWQTHFLSKVGRTTLIQSNLEALPVYMCSSFLLPKKTTTNHDNSHRHFFWNSNPSNNSIPLIAWDKVCHPKSSGGLGLRKTNPLNRAFIAKLGWNILTNNNLWASLMRKKYLHNTDFLSCKPKSSDSTIWRHIFSQRKILRKGILWKLGNGKDINFWNDNWAIQSSLKNYLHNITVNIEDWVAYFILPSKNGTRQDYIKSYLNI